MPEITESVSNLIDEFAKLPGIGRKSAERLTYHILRVHRDEACGLAEAIRNVKENVRYCKTCFNLAEQEECAICCDHRIQWQEHGHNSAVLHVPGRRKIRAGRREPRRTSAGFACRGRA